MLKDFVVKMLEEPNIDSPNSNAKFSTQTADPVAEPCEKLCEIVADTKAAIEPELQSLPETMGQIVKRLNTANVQFPPCPLFNVAAIKK